MSTDIENHRLPIGPGAIPNMPDRDTGEPLLPGVQAPLYGIAVPIYFPSDSPGQSIPK